MERINVGSILFYEISALIEQSRRAIHAQAKSVLEYRASYQQRYFDNILHVVSFYFAFVFYICVGW